MSECRCGHPTRDDRYCVVEGCDKPAKPGPAAEGHCSMHLARLKRHGDANHVTPRRKVDPSVRFWSKVDVRGEDECWVYGGTILGNGYGQFTVGLAFRQGAHRYAYEDKVGPIPEGLTLDHLCKNPPCVNPNHLEPVTMAENLRRSDAISSVNRRKQTCPKGHEYDIVRTSADGKESRGCRTCFNEWQRAYRAARKAAV